MCVNETSNTKLNKLPTIGLNTSKTASTPLRILSLDGGGIRGILPAFLLAKLERHIQEKTGNPSARLIDYFDFFTGTSAGGILISLYLTPSPSDPSRPKYSAKEVLDIYMNGGIEVFNTNKKPTKGYDDALLERSLKQLMGEDTLFNDLLKPTLMPMVLSTRWRQTIVVRKMINSI